MIVVGVTSAVLGVFLAFPPSTRLVVALCSTGCMSGRHAGAHHQSLSQHPWLAFGKLLIVGPRLYRDQCCVSVDQTVRGAVGCCTTQATGGYLPRLIIGTLSVGSDRMCGH